MAATDKVKRVRLFDRSYDDKAGVATVADSKSGETVMEVKVADLPPAMLQGIALRGLTDIIVGILSAGLKAEGGSAEKALESATETLEELIKGEYAFRAGAGEGGLSLEQEKDVIAKTAVALGYAPDVAAAMVIIEEAYTVTRERKQTVKGKERTVVDHPKYTELKRIPQIREALDKAADNTGAEKLAAVFGAKAPATE